MIIWTGHGILIPIFWFLGVSFGGMLGAGVGALAGANTGMGLGFVFGGLLGAGMVWLYALTLGKPTEQILQDPRTGQMVRLVKRHSLFFIPAFVWAILSSVGALPMAFAGVVMMTVPERDPAEMAEPAPGAAELRAAESLIASASKGIHHGNTPEALQMAETFSTTVSAIRDLAIEKGRTSNLSTSGGNFLTYCQQTEHGVAFLVHVPGLRRFSKDAKEVVSEAAWFAANLAVADLEPKPERLAVGVRGVLTYDAIWIGAPSVDLEDSDEESERMRFASSESTVLRPFFAAPELSFAEISAEEVPVEELAEGEPRIDAASALAAPAPAEASPDEREGSPSDALPETPATEAVEPEPAASLVPALASVLPTAMREWRSSDGRVMRASLLRFLDDSGDNAEFERNDGAVFALTIDRFDPETRAELGDLFSRSRSD